MPSVSIKHQNTRSRSRTRRRTNTKRTHTRQRRSRCLHSTASRRRTLMRGGGGSRRRRMNGGYGKRMGGDTYTDGKLAEENYVTACEVLTNKAKAMTGISRYSEPQIRSAFLIVSSQYAEKTKYYNEFSKLMMTSERRFKPKYGAEYGDLISKIKLRFPPQSPFTSDVIAMIKQYRADNRTLADEKCVRSVCDILIGGYNSYQSNSDDNNSAFEQLQHGLVDYYTNKGDQVTAFKSRFEQLMDRRDELFGEIEKVI